MFCVCAISATDVIWAGAPVSLRKRAVRTGYVLSFRTSRVTAESACGCEKQRLHAASVWIAQASSGFAAASSTKPSSPLQRTVAAAESLATAAANTSRPCDGITGR